MDLSLIDPRLRDATRAAAPILLHDADWHAATLRAHRALPGRDVPGVTRTTETADGVPLRVYVPDERSGGGLLWIHGGGLVLGSAAIDDVLCGQTARDTGAVVVSVDYRLAHEHPFPAAIEDCATGYAWLRAQGEAWGLDPARLAVGGQSAGGGLAACLAQRLTDEGTPPAAQVLLCPMLDDHTAADPSHDVAEHAIWDNRMNRIGWSAYLRDAFGAPEVPPYAVAARRDDLTGLPPTWIYTSDIELFQAEDTAYAARLSDAGVDVTFEVVPGVPHGFESLLPDAELSRALLDRMRTWLRTRLV